MDTLRDCDAAPRTDQQTMESCFTCGKWFIVVAIVLGLAYTIAYQCMYEAHEENMDFDTGAIAFMIVEGIMILLMLAADLFLLH